MEGMKKAGVERIYGVIGTSNIGFVNALYDYRGEIRYVSCRHEQVAASMADVEGRLRGKPGVALTHSGPGTLNALISVANAYKDGSPLILLSGAVKRKLKGTDGMLEVDHTAVFSTLCKGVFRLDEPRRTEEVFMEAYRASMSGCRGPVLIEVPEDVWEEDTGSRGFSGSLPRLHRPPLHVEDVWDCLGKLKQASRPLILSGAGVAYAGASPLLRAFAEAVKVPVITTGNGRGTLSESHPLCLGRAGFGGGNIVADAALSGADFILGLGCTLSDMTTYEYTLPVPGEVVLVNVDIMAAMRGLYKPAGVLEADVKDFLVEALETVRGSTPPERPDWWDFLESKREEWRKLLYEAASSGKTPLSPARVVFELNKMLPRRRIVTVGAGTHLLYAADFIPCEEPLTYLAATNFGAMGFGFAAAMAARLVHPDWKVVAVLGDGDFMMTIQDLETACREGIGVTILVINDCMYRVLNLRQRIQYQGRILGTCHTNPDFAALAEDFGARGFKMEKVEEIVPVLEEALAEEGPVVVEVISDPDDVPPMNLEATLRMGGG